VAERRVEPVRRFDASLDALVQEGVVTPGERVRVRGSLLTPQEALTRQRACRAGALSAQECSSGVIIIGRGRKDGLSDGLGESGLAAVGQGDGFGGFGLGAAPLPPITVPVSALLTGAGGSFRLTDVFRVTPRPAPILGNGNARLLFPLIGSAVTTSGFGWRLHPIVGSWLMHSGKDLAAPEGTPVVAALSGRVVSSGLAGGYGLAVELEHDRPRRRTLYGHLSELYVKEGEMVRQGEVIGRVGSTGLSTGPHLHFELRLPQEGGWVATDPGDLDPGGSLLAGLGGPEGASATDAVALLMGQLIATLERPRSPLPLPGERLPAPTARPSRG
jgi:murein DD-endopeptidase MepM/ murein hydrolase activator NlpD